MVAHTKIDIPDAPAVPGLTFRHFRGESDYPAMVDVLDRYKEYEAVHLLSRCGFQIESLVGDYDNGPVTCGSQLIFQALYSPFC